MLSVNDILISHFSPHYSGVSDEYMVLFNNTDADISLQGYEIAYSNAGGSLPSVKYSWIESNVIQSRKFRLMASNEFVTVGSISSKKADDIFQSFAADSGQIVLRLSTGGNIIYSMAYGNITTYKFGLSTSKNSVVSAVGGTYQLTASGKSFIRTGDNNSDYTLKAAADVSEIPNSFDPALSNSSGINNSTGELLKEFKLNQNFPNPFNPKTEITYFIRSVCKVQLKVYDLFGKEIVTLVDSFQQPGTYKFQFNSQLYNRTLSSGIYFYKLSAGNFVKVKKMTLLK
jgi:hypothetical protein